MMNRNEWQLGFRWCEACANKFYAVFKRVICDSENMGKMHEQKKDKNQMVQCFASTTKWNSSCRTIRSSNLIVAYLHAYFLPLFEYENLKIIIIEKHDDKI